MDRQEIDNLQRAIRDLTNSVEINSWTMEIAIEAIEKQIPKEPKYKEEKDPFGVYPYCPACGNLVFAGYECCVECGQAIDWGNEHG